MEHTEQPGHPARHGRSPCPMDRAAADEERSATRPRQHTVAPGEVTWNVHVVHVPIAQPCKGKALVERREVETLCRRYKGRRVVFHLPKSRDERRAGNKDGSR